MINKFTDMKIGFGDQLVARLAKIDGRDSARSGYASYISDQRRDPRSDRNNSTRLWRRQKSNSRHCMSRPTRRPSVAAKVLKG